jgi:hypothetical protein
LNVKPIGIDAEELSSAKATDVPPGAMGAYGTVEVEYPEPVIWFDGTVTVAG